MSSRIPDRSDEIVCVIDRGDLTVIRVVPETMLTTSGWLTQCQSCGVLQVHPDEAIEALMEGSPQ